MKVGSSAYRLQFRSAFVHTAMLKVDKQQGPTV